MDEKTLTAYSTNAQSYSHDWLAQPEPSDMYELLKKFFHLGGETADIGCGNGRDADWLSRNGYKVSGFDYSDDLIRIATGLYPQIKFSKSTLPELKEIQNQFDNVLCETVIMHLSQQQILPVTDSPKIRQFTT